LAEGHGLTWRLRKVARWRYSAIFLVDALIVCASFYLGYALRFEGRVPPEWLAQFRRYLPLLLAIRLPLHYAFGIHIWSFRLSGFHEALRVVLCSLTGSAFFVLFFFFFLQRAAEDAMLAPPRSVIAIEFFITTSLLGALRFSPRLAQTFPLDKIRSRPGETVRAVVVGAGSAGELLLRDLQRSDEHSYEVVGFVDDDPSKRGMSVGGRPVLGALDDLPTIVRRRGVGELLFAIPRMPAGRLREVVKLCSELKLGYRILPVSFAYLHDRVSASMLQALQPDDLLPRRPVTFDPEQIAEKLRGRRVLVTGAGGSIGSEVARQVAEQAPSRLVLTDIDENDLYLLYRHLQARHPGLALHAEVANIRDAPRLSEMFRRHRPQDVFHAAAHKHVPLMETAPAEAVKVNLTGFRNVVHAAEEGGVERFILISTDKAVDPSSVMGASKRAAELLVRHLAERSSATYTTVRFGNVLGSAGSVVPLFKAQIAAGGPVTVTDARCRRYLMTIGEAVGLVLMAGLSGYGDLCVLEMGEPILIVDLARLMITLAGFVPEDEVPIVFTGLRPGEKIDERLMTPDEEERSRPVSESIRVVDVAAPSPDWVRRLESLEALAVKGEAAAVVAALRGLVPGYTPDERWGLSDAAAVGSA
jgi:FlaA1/EpsC-like NDP-sugar epimerase